MASESEKSTTNSLVHVFMVTFPGQGNVNPLLRLGKRLASKGLLVTFSVAERVGKEMRAANESLITDKPTPYGDGMIRFEFFDDGWDYSQPNSSDFGLEMETVELVGKKSLIAIIKKQEEEGRPVSCIINSPFLPWVCGMAESLGIPNAVLWVQCCACFYVYYHYNLCKVDFPSESEPEKDVVLSGLPVLKYDEMPSFLHPAHPYPVITRVMLAQFKNLSIPFCVLVDSFHDLEHEVIEQLSNIIPVRTIGPLLFKDPKLVVDHKNKDLRGDCTKVEDCIEWLDTKPPSSVVYISFGSLVVLDQVQVDEIAQGLLSSGKSFLWVMKPPRENSTDQAPITLPDGFLEKIGDNGKIVKWCPQEQVLSHTSVACFMTHCGWNSSLEAIASGVPIVAFPQWGDQVTNAKFLVDVFKMGIRLSRGFSTDPIIKADDIDKCLREAMTGPKFEEMKENALLWKKKAQEAVAEGGSSDQNMQAFVDDVKRFREEKQKEKAKPMIVQ